MEEQNRGDGSCRVSGRAPGAGCRRAMAGRSKDDFSLDSPFIEQIIEKLFNEMPFEHVMEVCPDSKNAADLVLELYGKDLPNPIHEALGAALRDGSVHSDRKS